MGIYTEPHIPLTDALFLCPRIKLRMETVPFLFNFVFIPFVDKAMLS